MLQNPDLIPPIVITFDASDPSGGTGVQADIMTLSSMGCHPLSVVTAVTVQDTAGVEEVLSLDADWVSAQARALLEDMPVAAFKIGLMGSVEVMAAVAEIVSDYPDVPVVLDTVLWTGRDGEQLSEDMLGALRELLLPLAHIMTPNGLEARRLASDDSDADDDPDLAECGARLVAAGAEYVLVTGTHESAPQVVNTLYGEDGVVRIDTWERLSGPYHGSGCTLAAAIAANLANGLDAEDAVRDAQDYTWRALAAGFRPGMGRHLPDRFFWAREAAEDAEQSAQ